MLQMLFQRSLGGPNNLRKAAWVEASASDQSSVDVGLAHQLFGIVRLYTATILNSDPVRRPFVANLGEDGANIMMSSLSLVRSRGQSGSNRPHRLLSDD